MPSAIFFLVLVGYCIGRKALQSICSQMIVERFGSMYTLIRGRKKGHRLLERFLKTPTMRCLRLWLINNENRWQSPVLNISIRSWSLSVKCAKNCYTVESSNSLSTCTSLCPMLIPLFIIPLDESSLHYSLWRFPSSLIPMIPLFIMPYDVSPLHYSLWWFPSSLCITMIISSLFPLMILLFIITMIILLLGYCLGCLRMFHTLKRFLLSQWSNHRFRLH